MLALTPTVRVMEVGVQALFQPFGNLLHILLVNMFHEALQVGLKNIQVMHLDEETVSAGSLFNKSTFRNEIHRLVLLF